MPAPLRPVMVFVNKGERDKELGAAFQQSVARLPEHIGFVGIRTVKSEGG